MRTGRITAFVLSLALGVCTAFAGRVTVTNVVAAPRSFVPIVDISYDLLNPSGGMHTVLVSVSTNAGATYLQTCTNFIGATGAGVTTGIHKQVEWLALGDLPATTSTQTRVQVTATEGAWDYCIIDVSGGPNAVAYPIRYQATAPPTNDEHKTIKIVLRKITAGGFIMGSPTNELGRFDDEPRHRVTLTKSFYMGIYEITQAQYSNVMGVNPSYFTQGAHAPKRPVESVSWDIVRGGSWPGGTPGATTFMGRLRAKTGALACDLPTEAQWEYACRAGTTNALNNNTNLASIYQDANMDILGRYWYNGGSSFLTDPVNGAHTTVGSKLVNQWGLYDMHGNVWEWCLDWYGEYLGDAVDPGGGESVSLRVFRGGCWGRVAYLCRSAVRGNYVPDPTYDYIGFRVCVPY